MKIIEKLASKKPSFSFEFFPPKGEEGKELLFETVAHLAPYAPNFVSVTYGAGGGTRRLTVELTLRIERETGIECMAHLTCVGATQDEVRGVLDQLRAGGVENVLALRGDPPQGQKDFVVTEGGFAHASELVEFIRRDYDFCLAGACYPEKHPEAPSPELDLENLKKKVDAGAEFLVTQLFFDARDYFAFVERARAIGVTVPILAGIMPITNVNQVKRFTAMCGAHIPDSLMTRLEAVHADAQAVRRVGVEHAISECRALLDGGAPGIHFYTLNRSTATVEILDALR
ncbi:MAG: methylenetetrahydrofolate reductase [NAD(P)H] [Myxococcales bacterium]|nr:methylenetetrahydrofolate reductase [NAD(P)H] [Myxococcales bacterium]